MIKFLKKIGKLFRCTRDFHKSRDSPEESTLLLFSCALGCLVAGPFVYIAITTGLYIVNILLDIVVFIPARIIFILYEWQITP